MAVVQLGRHDGVIAEGDRNNANDPIFLDVEANRDNIVEVGR